MIPEPSAISVGAKVAAILLGERPGLARSLDLPVTAEGIENEAHPNILPIHDVNLDREFPYVVSELAPNGSARRLINDAEDHANPPELGTVERAMKRVKNGRYVLIPAGRRMPCRERVFSTMPV